MTLPLFEQLSPLLLEVSQGRAEFTPTPAETDRRARLCTHNSTLSSSLSALHKHHAW